MSDSRSGAFVAQVSLLGTATGVVKGNALHSALTVLNFRTAAITYHYGLSCHQEFLLFRFRQEDSKIKYESNSGASSRLPAVMGVVR
jgi:hypothetical protein